MERYYNGSANTAGAVVEVYGWYESAEWVRVRLVRKTALGWLVERA